MLSRMLLALSMPAVHAMTVQASLGSKSTAADVRSAFAVPDFLLNSGRKIPWPKATVVPRGTAVVTGANSGIGLEAAKELLKLGCRVVLCSRSVEAGEAALACLAKDEGVDASLGRVVQLDLADLDSIREAAREILDVDPSIALLLNNAGVMATPQLTTKQGFELQIGTNHIGHHALTRLLLPAMVDDGRVVTVASTAHTMGEVDTGNLFFDGNTPGSGSSGSSGDDDGTPRKYTPWGAYGQSKAANILFAKALADRLEAEGSRILSMSLHPGVIRTPLWRHSASGKRGKALTWLVHRFIIDKTVPQGASTSIYAALAPEDAVPSGAYLADCAVAEPNEQCADLEGSTREALWTLTEELISGAGLALPDKLLEAPPPPTPPSEAAEAAADPSCQASDVCVAEPEAVVAERQAADEEMLRQGLSRYGLPTMSGSVPPTDVEDADPSAGKA